MNSQRSVIIFALIILGRPVHRRRGAGATLLISPFVAS